MREHHFKLFIKYKWVQGFQHLTDKQLSGEGHGAAAEELWPVGTASQITRGPGDNTGMKVWSD